MVWSQEDFIREVRRQLVELESLRRKVEEEADVTENLEQLEESQLYLLRKLNDYFRARPEEQPGVPEGIPESVQAYLRVLLEEPTLLQQLVHYIDASEPGATIVILGITHSISHRHASRFSGLSGLEGDFHPPYSLN